MPGHSVITHKSKQIYYFDHRGLSGQALIDSVKAANQKLLTSMQPQVLMLADFRDTYANSEMMAYMKSDETRKAAARVSKTAVLGVSGIKAVLLNAYNIVTGGGAKPFDDEVKAKDYLVQ